MATRFVKAKVDKCVQLYSKFGKNEETTYDRVYEIAILKGGAAGYTSGTSPIILFSPHPPGSSNVNATATANVVNGSIRSVTITNPGTGYTTAPTITLSPTNGGVVLKALTFKKEEYLNKI